MAFEDALEQKIQALRAEAAHPQPGKENSLDAARKRLVPKVVELIADDARSLAEYLLSRSILPNTPTVETIQAVMESSGFLGRRQIHTHDAVTYGPSIWHLATRDTYTRVEEEYYMHEYVGTKGYGHQRKGLGLLAMGELVEFDFASVRVPVGDGRSRDIQLPLSSHIPVDGDLLVNRFAFDPAVSPEQQRIVSTWRGFLLDTGAMLATGQPFTPRISRHGTYMPNA